MKTIKINYKGGFFNYNQIFDGDYKFEAKIAKEGLKNHPEKITEEIKRIEADLNEITKWENSEKIFKKDAENILYYMHSENYKNLNKSAKIILGKYYNNIIYNIGFAEFIQNLFWENCDN